MKEVSKMKSSHEKEVKKLQVEIIEATVRVFRP